jgi:hypothetical protein
MREGRMEPPESNIWDCHGTGTSLGDPIEVGAIRKVQIKSERLEPLMIATSKSNLGHLEGGSAAIAMVKCVMVVLRARCAPSQHIRVLNPHLENTIFDARFMSEAGNCKFKRNHCQVSSFGVGGTNGHAIFWGEYYKAGKEIDAEKLLDAKLRRHQPTLIANGSNPEDWDFSGPDFKSKPGDRYIISIERDPITGETPIRWIKADPVESKPEFYAVTGNFNSWSSDRMDEGDVPGLYYIEAEIQYAGTLEFRFLIEGDESRALGPVDENCTRRTAPMDEIRSDCKTSWCITGSTGDLFRIELHAPPNAPRTVSWLRCK